ncbi:MAG: hypothetical protein ACO23T_01360 [Hylemonella sp.]
MAKPSVDFIGLGQMGMPMVLNLAWNKPHRMPCGLTLRLMWIAGRKC